MQARTASSESAVVSTASAKIPNTQRCCNVFLCFHPVDLHLVSFNRDLEKPRLLYLCDFNRPSFPLKGIISSFVSHQPMLKVNIIAMRCRRVPGLQSFYSSWGSDHYYAVLLDTYLQFSKNLVMPTHAGDICEGCLKHPAKSISDVTMSPHRCDHCLPGDQNLQRCSKCHIVRYCVSYIAFFPVFRHSSRYSLII